MYSSNKNVVFLCLLFLISVKVQSQNTAIDSLKNQLLIHKEKDTAQVNILNALAFSYHQIDAALSLEHLEASELISKSINFDKGTARSLFLKGLIEMQQFNLDQAISNFEESILLYEKTDYKSGIAKCYSKIGLATYYKRDYDGSVAYFKNSIRIDESLGNIKETALNLKYIGYAYTDSDNFDEALIHLNKAIEINKEYKDKQELASCLNNLGILYADRTNFPLVALKYYSESLEVSEEITDSLGMLKALNNMGNIYMLNENPGKAIEKLKRSLVIQKNLGNNSFLGITRNNLGNLYKKQGKFEIALAYLTEALEKSKELNDKYTESTTLNNIGGVYRALENYSLAGQFYNEGKNLKIEIQDDYGLCGAYTGIAYNLIAQKRYSEALVSTLKAHEISERLDIIGLERDVYDLFSRIYKNTGNYKKAFESHEQLKVLNDSLFNKKNIEKLAALEYEYKYKRALDSASIRELQLTRTVTATSQNLEKSQRNLLLGIITFLGVVLLLGSIILFLKLRNVKEKNQNILIEQKLLRSQMTPHFIFNSLSVLQGMILNKEEEKSISYLSKFSKLLRTILENSRHKAVSLSEELIAIDSYMALQNLDVSPPYNYSLSVAPEINKSALKIPPMLIQPFIENAIEHAFAEKKDDKEILVELAFEGDSLVCTITDNGIGFDMEQQKNNKNKNSLATTITSERLKMLSKDFNAKGSLSVKNREQFGKKGTLVTLVIPYKLKTIS